MLAKFTINKKEYHIEIKGNETLLEVLRNDLGLTGTKTACEESECGTCTVTVNGKAFLSCITLAAAVAGDDIITIEGLADGDKLHPLQQAYIDTGAAQCGFCIPGMIMSSKALLDKTLDPTQEEIDYALDGNLCRCAGYPQIFKAIKQAAEVMKSSTNEEAPEAIKNRAKVKTKTS